MSEWSDRYLRLLRIGAATPTLEWLSRFGAAHVASVPFSNQTSVMRRFEAGSGPAPPLDLDALLSTWERGAGGGVCFETASMVLRLLQSQGFQAYPVLAKITFPGSHQAVVAEVDGRRFIIDLGVGAPLPEPVPLDRISEYHAAGLSYRFVPDLDAMTCVQERLIDGEWQPFCHYDLNPARDADREAAYQRNHDPTVTWVTTTVTLVRYLGGEVLQVRNASFMRHTAQGKHTTAIASPDDLQRIIANDICLPNLPVHEALSALQTITGRDLFTPEQRPAS